MKQLAQSGSVAGFPVSSDLVVDKKENLVFLDRAPERSPECVANQLAGLIRQSCLDLGRLVEPVVGMPEISAVVFIQAAVKSIGPALGHKRDLCARRTAAVCVGVGCADPKLFHRIQRRSQRASEGVTLSLVVVVYSVERDEIGR